MWRVLLYITRGHKEVFLRVVFLCVLGVALAVCLFFFLSCSRSLSLSLIFSVMTELSMLWCSLLLLCVSGIDFIEFNGIFIWIHSSIGFASRWFDYWCNCIFCSVYSDYLINLSFKWLKWLFIYSLLKWLKWLFIYSLLKWLK